MVNLFFLKTFVDAAKTGSFRLAAFKNFVTQPAVTQHILILEKKLKCKLFERQGGKAVLTSCGKVLLLHAEKILKQFEEAKTQVSETSKKIIGTVRIATIYSIGLYQLKPIVQTFLKKFPEVEIHLEYHPVNKIYEMVYDRSVDFGFVAFPYKKQGIVSKIFAEEELVLVQSSQYPIFNKKTVSLKELNGARFVAFSSNTPTRRKIDHFLHNNKVFPKVINDYDNIETLKSAIELGIGCSIIPLNILDASAIKHNLERIPLKGFDVKRPLGILYSKGKVFSASARVFYEIVASL